MRNRKEIFSLVALAASLTAFGSALLVACSSDDSASGGGGTDGSVTDSSAGDSAVPGDARSTADACAAETFGEDCTPDAGCSCGGVCAARKCVAPSKCNEALLTWTGPTENVDGTCITDLGGFIVNYWYADGGSPSDHVIDAGLPCAPGAVIACGDAGKTVVQLECAYRVTGLAPNGVWDFTTSDYNDAGAQSDPSGVVSKDVECP